jgi:rubrerythrin
MGASRLLGDRAALKALKEGEESGIKQYRSLIDDKDTPADVRDAAMKLMKNEKEHCTRLDTMMETLETA